MSHPCDIEAIKLLAGCTDAEIFSVVDKFRSQSRSFIIPPVDSVLK